MFKSLHSLHFTQLVPLLRTRPQNSTVQNAPSWTLLVYVFLLKLANFKSLTRCSHEKAFLLLLCIREGFCRRGNEVLLMDWYQPLISFFIGVVGGGVLPIGLMFVFIAI